MTHAVENATMPEQQNPRCMPPGERKREREIEGEKRERERERKKRDRERKNDVKISFWDHCTL
jgi:hypothetical protein